MQMIPGKVLVTGDGGLSAVAERGEGSMDQAALVDAYRSGPGM
jgi:hypothetical protein